MSDEFVDEDSMNDYQCYDIPKTLRLLAQEIENGETNAFQVAIVIREVEGVQVRGLGPGADQETVSEMLVEGLNELSVEDEE